MLLKMRQVIVVFSLSLLFLTSCATQAPSRFEQAQQESSQRGSSAVVKESESGGSFNKFSPFWWGI
ncbi:hypothetical protein CWATWH0402_2362 [Crocosphaera watsonii WH 0402]|uniref:Uncharacterized protein n=1 Tax=Crocosphaera watsonii WH 0402 TaxID=1284629 RepID=T2JUP5_CROWT|nr:hypothetical protein CWATWH0402_2362 [Crocosphaera watsonii WH 0402]